MNEDVGHGTSVHPYVNRFHNIKPLLDRRREIDQERTRGTTAATRDKPDNFQTSPSISRNAPIRIQEIERSKACGPLDRAMAGWAWLCAFAQPALDIDLPLRLPADGMRWHPSGMKIDSRPARLRGRYLSGDEHTAVWVRRRNREQRLHVLRSLWRSSVGALVVGGAALGGVTALIPWSFARGLVVGAGAASLLSLITYVVLALSGTVATGMGATAEAWTAADLRRLRKYGWHVINGLSWQGRDVDHVLIGPGGIIVVESKWSADGWNVGSTDPHVSQAVDQAISNTRTISLWEPVKASGAKIHTVVILWGGHRKGPPQRQDKYITTGETVIAYGSNAVAAWVDSVVRLPTTTPPDTAVFLWKQLAAYVASREHADVTAAPPPSIDRFLWTSVAAALTFVLTIVGCLNAFTSTNSWWIGVATIFVALCAFLVARERWPGVRVPIGAGLLGLAVVSTIAASSAVASALG